MRDECFIRLPRFVAAELPRLHADLAARTHALLERNADGALSCVEREELATLVRMIEVAHILTMAVSRGL